MDSDRADTQALAQKAQGAEKSIAGSDLETRSLAVAAAERDGERQRRSGPRALTHVLRGPVVLGYLAEIGGPTRDYPQKNFARDLARIGVLPRYDDDARHGKVRAWLSGKALAEDDARAVARILSDRLRLNPPLDVEHVATRRREQEFEDLDASDEEVTTSSEDAFSLPLTRLSPDVVLLNEGYRGVALEIIKHHHRLRRGGAVRLVAFTAHTLVELMTQLLGEPDTTVHARFATLEAARQLGMLRQVELMEEFLSPSGLADLADYLVTNPRRLTIEWLSEMPKATAIALGTDAYCWNEYRMVNVASQRDRRTKTGRAEVAHLPPGDAVSISGVDQSALLALRPVRGAPSSLFDQVQRDFEKLWATTDPAPSGDRVDTGSGAVAEMTRMLEKAQAKLRRRRS